MLSDIINNEGNSKIQHLPRVDYLYNKILHPLNITEMSPTNSIQADQEKETDGEIIPAAFPTSSKQEDEKNERLREFRVQYSLQPNNSNANKRKRIESHDDVVFAPYT
jgi:hypothetical protein